jgi:PAS domain S-box-containing protein/putative nucleotidyltransferase with HDIG domain
MKDARKTKKQLTDEAVTSHRQIGEAKKSESERTQKGTSPQILIVDDDPQVLNVLAEILRAYNYLVRTASSGHMALQEVVDEVPDMILMDVKMPDMDGYKVCHRLKSDERSRMTPVIFISGLDEAEDKVKGFKAGGVDYITKPFRAVEVLARIKIHLELRYLQKQLEEQNVHLQQEITVRKQAEDALRESERRLYDIINFLPDATFAINRKGKVIAWNKAIEEMTGIKADDMLGKGDYEYNLPFYGERRPSLIDLVLRADEEIEERYQYVRRYGNILLGEAIVNMKEENLTLSGKASPLYDSDGNIIGAIESIRDITEQKLTEDALYHAEAEYRAIFENAQEGIFRSTFDGRFIIANRALASMLHYDSPRELVNAVTDIPHHLYVNPGDYETLIKMIEEYGPVKGFEVQLYRKGGSMLWVSINMHTVSDTDGQLMYYEGIVEDIAVRKKADEERKQSIKRLEKTLGATVQAMAVVVETRDPYTAGHQKRVSCLAHAIATEMGLSKSKIEGVRMMGAIHDLGKLAVPAEILSKPTKLTEVEFCLIKTHSQAGYEILKEIDFPWPVSEIVLQHHEKIDGSGYPRGLKGKDILLEAKIVCVADVVEAMASHRPYRPSLGIEKALKEISRNRGILYDPDVVDACIKLFHEKGYKMGG